METPEEAELCFPTVNNSCKASVRPELEEAMVYTLLSAITVATAVLNLLVIISISHFRQLHTSTNLLLLSLAVSDFLVGSVQMPFQIFFYRGCWFLGDVACSIYFFSAFVLIAVSVGNMILISADRYVAICDPLLYPTKVTVKRVQGWICLCWTCATVNASWLLRDLLKQPGVYNTCIGECVIIIKSAEGVFDVVFWFVAPFIIITVLYMRVFVVAVSQARAMRSHVAAVVLQRSGRAIAKKSELKAAKTLGILVLVFLMCSCPYYAYSVAAEINQIGSSGEAEVWLIFFNSCANPIIYAFSYQWFRRSIKHIVTLQILEPDSRQTNIL